MKYFLEGKTLTIENFSITDTMEFLSILKTNKITCVIPKSNLSYPCLFLIKKYTKADTFGWNVELATAFKEIKCRIPAPERRKESYKMEWFFRTLYMFTFRNNNQLQNQFWLETFYKINTTVLLDNIIIVLILFFCIGIAVAFLLYSEFIGYGIQMESARVSVYAGIKIFCPMFTAFMIMSKSCTALSMIILTMYRNGDPRIMQLMGLPFNRVYLNPLFFSLLISGPLMNILAIIGFCVGCLVAWVIKGNSPDLFISLVQKAFSLDWVLDSTVRAGLSSLVYGIAACIGGTARYSSSDAVVVAVNSCVVIAAIGNVVVQAVISGLTTLN